MTSEDITIKSFPSEKIISMKKTTNFMNLAEEVKRAFNEVGGKILVAGGTVKGNKFVIFHHKEGRLNPDRLDIEICVPVVGLSKPPIDWELDTTNTIKTAACITHKGPYNKDVGRLMIGYMPGWILKDWRQQVHSEKFICMSLFWLKLISWKH